ncbi:MAG: reverse transcriptase family protein, partial [Anaplasma sp.]|nr:reverse transcriptase family protein [Anaplasma sp.]
KIAVVVYLDIKKAFDTVNHSILLNKLHQYGFRGKTSQLFSSYLSDRKQCVVINDFTSTPRTVLTGVPQGSVLGPILFSLYVNDFPSILKYSEALMYADDTALIFVGDTIGELQDKINEELTTVLAWFTSNQLTLNLKKSKYTVFHSKKKAINYDELVIRLDNTKLQHVACYKYLGVLFDSDMHWKSQIKHICSKIAYGCYTLLKARECFDLFILRILYFAFVHSQLVYCIESWGNTYATYLDPVTRLQKRAIRFITFSRTTDPSRRLFLSLNV